MSARATTIVICALAMVVFTAGFASAQVLPPYFVTVLPVVSGTESASFHGTFGDGMSGSGNYVTGISIFGATDFTYPMGFRYDGTTTNPLGSLAATSDWYHTEIQLPETIGSQPWAVNNSGTVVGQYAQGSGWCAFYSTSGGAPVAIPGFPTGAQPMAYGINDNGLIVGEADMSNPGYAGFTYNPSTGALTSLPFSALAVNDLGEMAGCVNGGVQSGFGYGSGAWQDASGTVHTISSLMQADAIDSTGTYVVGQGSNSAGSPALYNTVTGTTTQFAVGWGCNDTAYSVNSSGVVVGSYAGPYTGGSSQGYVDSNAFIYANGTTQYIGDLTLASAPANITWTLATSINDAGKILVQGVVGTYPGTPVTCLLTPALPGDANLDGTVDINDLTVVLAHYGQTGMTWSTGEFTGDGTVDINDLTIVLAHYGQSQGTSAACPAPVPEPSCLVLLGVGGVGLLACSRRKRRRSRVLC